MGDGNSVRPIMERYGKISFKVYLKIFWRARLTEKWKNLAPKPGKVWPPGRWLRALHLDWFGGERLTGAGGLAEKARIQLKLGWDFLNATGKRYRILRSGNCRVCNVLETRDHYLLRCCRFSVQRDALLRDLALAGVVNPSIKCLLCGVSGDPNVDRRTNGGREVIRLVERYITDTKRYKEGYGAVVR